MCLQMWLNVSVNCFCVGCKYKFRATVEATIAKQRQDYEDFTEKLKEDEQQRQQEDEQAAADEESMAMVKSMIEGLREIHGKPRHHRLEKKASQNKRRHR